MRFVAVGNTHINRNSSKMICILPLHSHSKSQDENLSTPFHKKSKLLSNLPYNSPITCTLVLRSACHTSHSFHHSVMLQRSLSLGCNLATLHLWKRDYKSVNLRREGEERNAVQAEEHSKSMSSTCLIVLVYIGFIVY
jgi:hypothetical protein